MNQWPKVMNGEIINGTSEDGREITIGWCTDCGRHPSVIDVDSGLTDKGLTAQIFLEDLDTINAAGEILLTRNPEKLAEIEEHLAERILPQLPKFLGIVVYLNDAPVFTTDPLPDFIANDTSAHQQVLEQAAIELGVLPSDLRVEVLEPERVLELMV